MELCRDGAQAWAKQTGNEVKLVSTPADAQERLHARVAELDIECHAEPFEYWKKQPGRKR